MPINISDIINSTINITTESQRCYPPCNVPDIGAMIPLIFICLTISYFHLNEYISDFLKLTEEQKNKWYFRPLKHDFWVGSAWTISLFFVLLSLFYGG